MSDTMPMPSVTGTPYQAGDRVTVMQARGGVPAVVIQTRADGEWAEVIVYPGGFAGPPGAQGWHHTSHMARIPPERDDPQQDYHFRVHDGLAEQVRDVREVDYGNHDNDAWASVDSAGRVGHETAFRAITQLQTYARALEADLFDADPADANETISARRDESGVTTDLLWPSPPDDVQG